jgi:hypothetical protein
MKLAGPFLCLLYLSTALAQVKSRELEDLFNSDSLKPKPKSVAQKKTPPPPKRETGERAVGIPAGHDPERHLLRRAGVKCRVQLVSQESVREVDPDSTFHTGDRIRLLLEPNIDGYLYIIQTGTSGKESILFPHQSINGGRNEVLRGRLYSIPPTGFFRFGGPAGEERVKVILSRTPLESLPAAAPAKTFQLAMNLVNTELDSRVRARDLVYVAEDGPAAADQGRGTAQAVIWLNTSADQNNVVFFDLKLKHE